MRLPHPIRWNPSFEPPTQMEGFSCKVLRAMGFQTLARSYTNSSSMELWSGEQDAEETSTPSFLP